MHFPAADHAESVECRVLVTDSVLRVAFQPAVEAGHVGVRYAVPVEMNVSAADVEEAFLA